MNSKSGILLVANRHWCKYSFWCSFGEIKIDLTPKKSNILYVIVSPLNIGAIFQTVIGPSLWNWPRQSSIKKTGNAPRTSTVKYGMIKAPENKEKKCFVFYRIAPESNVKVLCAVRENQ